MWKILALLLAMASTEVTGKPPHIIFIVADDLGWNDVGWHNPNMYTPNLDKLALNGVRLNSSYVQPLCTPFDRAYEKANRYCKINKSNKTEQLYKWHRELALGAGARSTLALVFAGVRSNQSLLKNDMRRLTRAEKLGCRMSRDSVLCCTDQPYAYNRHGVIRSDSPAFLPENITTLPQRLKGLGYTTHMIGKWHLGFCNWKFTPTQRGFDSFMGYYSGMEDYYTHSIADGYDFRWNKTVYNSVKGDYSANVIGNHAVDLINAIDPESQPLYLYLPFQSVHSPLEVPERYKNLPPYKDIKSDDRRTYCGMVSALDEAVGNITDALRKRGYMNNSLIVFTSDNGGPIYATANNLPLRGDKGSLWEGGTKGAAFVYSETLLKKSKYENTELMHAVDWYPTLLSLAGGNPDPTLDGRNQWSMLSEGKSSARTEFVYNIDQLANNSAIRVGKYKLIQGSPGRFNGWAPVPNIDGKQEQLEFAGPQQLPPYQLFDLDDDPTEHFDIADKHPDILEDMKKKLEKYKESEVPPNVPPSDPKADPKYFGGNWSPGWC